MYFRKQSDPHILNRSRIAIMNSLSDDEILEQVARFGYNEAAILEGKALLDTATELYQRHLREHDEQWAATRHQHTAFKRAHRQYMDFVNVARVVFKNNPDAYQRLGLAGERARVFTDWLPQVRRFYTVALQEPDILNTLSSEVNITRERLEAGVQLVDETVAAYEKQIRETGEAQQATPEKNAAIDALYEWVHDYLTVAEIALKANPQLLEKLGLVVKS